MRDRKFDLIEVRMPSTPRDDEARELPLCFQDALLSTDDLLTFSCENEIFDYRDNKQISL